MSATGSMKSNAWWTCGRGLRRPVVVTGFGSVGKIHQVASVSSRSLRRASRRFRNVRFAVMSASPIRMMRSPNERTWPVSRSGMMSPRMRSCWSGSSSRRAPLSSTRSTSSRDARPASTSASRRTGKPPLRNVGARLARMPMAMTLMPTTRTLTIANANKAINPPITSGTATSRVNRSANAGTATPRTSSAFARTGVWATLTRRPLRARPT